jgi:anti-anti-sigma regulatory factor
LESHVFGSPDGFSWSPVVTASSTFGVDDPVLHLWGRVEGHGLLDLARSLDRAVSDSTGQVTLDLSAVESWSLLAQAMVLNTARVLAARHRHLVLVGASPTLRDQSVKLQLFERVPTARRSPDG